MKAVILAGGLGTRLHPLTVDRPKPMVPLANRPLMAHTMELLSKHGFNDLTVLLYHQAEMIKEYFGDGSKFGVSIRYVEATEDYGTAGAVRFACQEMKEPFLVISADLFTDIDLAMAFEHHKKAGAFATIVLTRVANPLSYGIVITDASGRVQKFLEKPSWGEVFSDTANAGIYILDPGVLEHIPYERACDFGNDLFPSLVASGKSVFGFVAEGYWKDIGQIDDYNSAHRDVLNGVAKVGIPGRHLSDRQVWLGDSADLPSSVKLKGAVVIGGKTLIGEGASLQNCIIGEGCRIDRGAQLRECVIFDGVEIGADASLERAVVGSRARIGSRVIIEEGVVVGDESEVERGSVIKSYIKIWPRKIIEEGAVVSRSIIWRERWSRSVFGPYGVTGICNVEVTPQFASALGAAYGSILGKGSRITCSRDSHKASRMTFRAIVAGVLSTGVNVSNLEMVPMPVNRYDISTHKSSGGFHVRKSPFDPEVIDIKFFDGSGMDLSSMSEKKIERLFFGEDFKRTAIEDIGELSYPLHRVSEMYRAGVLDGLDTSAIYSSNLKVAIDYSFGSSSQIFPSILGELGMEVVALNSHIDDTKITKDKATFERSLEQMTKIVKGLGLDLGIMLDTGAEKIFVSDEKGNVLDGRQTLGIMALMALKQRNGAVIALPIKESRSIEDMIEKHGGRIVWTKSSLRGMMEAASSDGIDMLGESHGGFIFPKFMPSFDGMLSTCKLLEFLSREKVRLSDLVREVPPSNIVKVEIPCSSEQKGMMMRRAIDTVKDADRLHTIDGVKFWHGRDWALILPDAVRSVIYLYAEADTERKSRSLMDKYVRILSNVKEG